MNRRILLGISAVTTWTCFLSGLAVAQKKTLKEQLVGSWLIVTADNIRPDGSRFQSLGPNPKGIMMFDANGWFSYQAGQPGRPKFASDNELRKRTRPLCKEASPTTANTRSMKRTAFFTSILSSYPNFDGIDNKRIITSLSEDKFTWYSPAGSIGTTAEVVWKRAK